MDALEAIRTRRSLRQFKPEPVPKEILEKIVDAGRLAPSAINIQPWEFVVITEKPTLRRLAALTDYDKFMSDAAACIAVFCKDTKYYLEDGCAAVENILVAAWALGVGSCWVAGDKKPYCRAVAQALNVPDEFKLVALIPLG